MLRSVLMRGAAGCALVLVDSLPSLRAQEALPTIDIGAAQLAAEPAAPEAPAAAAAAPGFTAERLKSPVYRDPPGNTVTTVATRQFEDQALTSVADILQYSPGVTATQGTGPRDFGISIRGSNARNAFGVRNLVLMEDGFPLTTADGGNSRTDNMDPHAYAGFDVYRGPSSALFGNYAISGAINFRMRSGTEIDGFQTGHEFDSFGTIANYIIAGKRSGPFDLSLFVSDQRGDGYIAHTDYNTQTIDFLGTWAPTPNDRLILKVLQNDLHTDMYSRISQNQFYLNPYQKNYGCTILVAANAPFCASVPGGVIFANGVAGAPAAAQSSAEIGMHRYNWRDIVGLRYEHDFDGGATWRSQALWDYTDNQQPTNPTWQTRGPTAAANASTDVTSHLPVFGRPATHYLSFIYNNAHVTQDSFMVLPYVFNEGAVGSERNKLIGFQSDVGLRAREEIAISDKLTAVGGVSATWTKTYGSNTSFTYATTGLAKQPSQIDVAHSYFNWAPEASLTYRLDPEWRLRSRFGASYGTPYFSQLFTNSQGLTGDNSSLKTQTNLGVDLGVEWTPAGKNLTISLTGFNDWFRNEQLTMVAANGVSYVINAPASIHRGAELGLEWRPIEGWRLYSAYSHDNFVFTDFMEPISTTSGAAKTAYMNRSGNQIAGVPHHQATLRVGYDQPSGDLKGLGGFVEYVYRGNYAMDNANYAWAPSYGIVNIDIHYSRDLASCWIKNVSLFFDVKNVFDRVYMSSAQAVTDTLASNGLQNPGPAYVNSGSIQAGAPRTFSGGVRFKF